jgi:hypothetical protein
MVLTNRTEQVKSLTLLNDYVSEWIDENFGKLLVHVGPEHLD